MQSSDGGQNVFVKALAARPFFFATLAHLLFAFLLFSPFFFEGKILVASTDNYFATWVNYHFSHETLAHGDLGFWNPNILGGIDFSASPHNHLDCPLDWPLFLLPEHLFFYGLTVQVFLLVFLCGVFAFLFFREELGNAKWAFLAALLYQLGDYTFFSITTFSNIQLYTFSMVTAYLIWTAHRRRPILSYALWTPCLVILMVGGNPLYSFAACVLLAVLFVYHYWPASWAIWRRDPAVLAFYGAALTAVLVAAPRWLPVGHSLLFVGSRADQLGGINNSWGRTFLALRAFIPESFGINMQDSIPYLQSLQGQGHAQAHGFNFFGVAGILLVVLALALRVPKTRFWLPFLLLNSAWLLIIPPFSAMLDLLAYPFTHTIVPKLMIPIAFCAVAAHTAAYLEANWDQVAAKLHPPLLWAIGLAAVMVITVWGTHQAVSSFTGPGADVPAHRHAVVRAKFAFLFCTAMLLAMASLILRRAGRKHWAPWLLALAVPLGLLLLYWLSGRWHLFDQALYRSSFWFLTTASLGSMLLMLAYLAFERGWLSAGTLQFCCFGLVLGTAGAILLPTVAGGQLSDRQMTLTMGLGTFKFLIIGFGIVYLLVSMSRRPELRPMLFPSLCTILLIDLLPFNKNHSQQVTEPFVRRDQLYPDRSEVVHPVAQATESASQNLLVNPSFETWDPAQGMPQGWVMGGRGCRVSRCQSERVFGQVSAEITAGQETTYLAQDVLSGAKLAGRKFTFGTWVKAPTSRAARLLLTDGHVGAASAYDMVPEQWVWLSTTLVAGEHAQYIRAHVAIEPGAHVLTDGAILVQGWHVDPYAFFPGQPAAVPMAGFHGIVPQQTSIDATVYRVNHPHLVLRIAGNELETNIPAFYGIRSYGGVNSDVPTTLIELIGRFQPSTTPHWYHNGAINALLTDPKLLDLLGCGYDVDQGGHPIERPTALARFMVFHRFEVVPDHKQLLERLAARDFVARDKLLLEADPGLKPADSTAEAKIATYTSPKTSELQVSCDTPTSALLFFGDNYHPGWVAYVNGQKVRVLRADYNFMAVPLPAGKSTVVFRFQPRPFYAGVAISACGLCGFLFVFLIAWQRRRAAAHRAETVVLVWGEKKLPDAA